MLMDLQPQTPASSLPLAAKKGSASESLRMDAQTLEKRRQTIAALNAIGDVYPLNPGPKGIAGLLARGRR